MAGEQHSVSHFLFLNTTGEFLRNPAAFESYLQRTVVNLSRSHFRHAKVERTHAEPVSRAPTAPAADRSIAERDELWRALERRGRFVPVAIARATSSIVATPVALSIAPL